MISRSEIYAAIDKELTCGKDADLLSDLLPAEADPKDHVSFVAGYVDAAKVLDQTEADRLRALLDVAVLAVRCLEHHGLSRGSISRLFDEVT